MFPFKRTLLYAFSLFLLFTTFTSPPIFAQHLLGEFTGLQLNLDTQIESPPQHNNVLTLSEQAAGSTLQFQLFAPSAAGKQTVGYNIELELTGKSFFDHINDLSGTTWTGSPLSPTTGKPILTALLISAPVIPDNGYLGQITLQISNTIASGSTLIVKSASMADLSADNDALNVSSAIISFTSGIPAFAGDFDLDGDVDFVDFLTFAKNFGQSGPPPTGGNTTTITTTVVVKDTITVTQTDTIFIGNANDSPQLLRAEQLLGFWAFVVQLPSQVIIDDYLMGDIRIDEADPDGEFVVLGSDAFGTTVVGGYSADAEAYLILYENTSISILYVFNIQANQVAGSVLSFLPTETIEQATTFDLLPESGRSNGFPPRSPASKRAFTTQISKANGQPITPEIIQAYNWLKKQLDITKKY